VLATLGEGISKLKALLPVTRYQYLIRVTYKPSLQSTDDVYIEIIKIHMRKNNRDKSVSVIDI